ncbi:S-adenosyl-L-methionine-dependent methyltransferase [Aspergillus karnatakaensis]|uniref:class I SAM-dependent DNA methyltransferase n=1 Tax=Aspergillus karnatakaensis TaxID=1810916 RepID=UPI003CCDD80E
MSPPPTFGITDYLPRAFALSGTSEAKTFYDEWAGAYDTDINSVGYASPRRAVEAIIDNLSTSLSCNNKLRILDAGCGTGLVGDCLTRSSLAGKFELDGVDLSEGMLSVARKKGVYRHLDIADLTKGIEKEDGGYDVVVCVGTLTKGHVGAEVLGEFARLTREGGLVVATVHEGVWESGGFEGVIGDLKDKGIVDVVGLGGFGILEEESTGGRMVVLRRA